MPSTYSSLTYHIVFSTKLRQPLIDHQLRERLYAYFGGIVQSEGGTLIEIGGVEDHVHLLVGLKTTHSISDFMRVIKSNSSKWINEEQLVTNPFAWQEGYSVFTVSHSQIETVRKYLQRQEEHHAKSSFRDELHALCERHDMPFDSEHFDQG